MRLSLFSETAVIDAAQLVLSLNRSHHERLLGLPGEVRLPGNRNPYVKLFSELYRFSRTGLGERENAAAQLGVADTLLDNVLYAGDERPAEGFVLRVVVLAARARLRQLEGEPLTPDEIELLS